MCKVGGFLDILGHLSVLRWALTFFPFIFACEQLITVLLGCPELR